MIAAAHARHDEHKCITIPFAKMHEPVLLLLLALTGIGSPNFENSFSFLSIYRKPSILVF
jgi:hypothetical protein